MGFDVLLKRYFTLIVCLLLGITAYFQASGMGQLVAASVALDPSAMPSAGPAPRSLTLSHATSDSDHSTSAASILSRNPFDSVTGPLDGTQAEIPALPTDSGPVDDTKDPRDDPACDVGRVLLITQSEDPAWSFAAIAGSDGKSQLRRQGDDVSGHTVTYIGWNRVWLTSGSSRCQMLVGAKAPAAAKKTETSEPTTGRKGKKVPPEIASKIKKVSESEFEVERSVVNQILENQADLMRSARIVPEKEGDKVVGIRLFGIRPDSLLGTLGLENGDRLSSINGFDIADPQKALEAYARLRTADRLTVSVNRRGKPMNIDFAIK